MTEVVRAMVTKVELLVMMRMIGERLFSAMLIMMREDVTFVGGGNLGQKQFLLRSECNLPLNTNKLAHIRNSDHLEGLSLSCNDPT